MAGEKEPDNDDKNTKKADKLTATGRAALITAWTAAGLVTAVGINECNKRRELPTATPIVSKNDGLPPKPKPKPLEKADRKKLLEALKTLVRLQEFILYRYEDNFNESLPFFANDIDRILKDKTLPEENRKILESLNEKLKKEDNETSQWHEEFVFAIGVPSELISHDLQGQQNNEISSISIMMEELSEFAAHNRQRPKNAPPLSIAAQVRVGKGIGGWQQRDAPKPDLAIEARLALEAKGLSDPVKLEKRIKEINEKFERLDRDFHKACDILAVELPKMVEERKREEEIRPSR